MKKWSIRLRIFRGKVNRLLGREHKHLFDGRFTGKLRDNPCLICGRTFHQLGSGRKTVPDR